MHTKLLRFLMFTVVLSITFAVVYLSFLNTSKLAHLLHIPAIPTAFLVEVSFATLLWVRSHQRTKQLNVPLFLDIVYFAFFGIVTGVNVWGLSQVNGVIGSIVGLVISGSMWSMENVLVWLVTESEKPYEPTVSDKYREAKGKIKDEKRLQKIEWMLYESKKPDLKLIEKARKEDRRRQQVLEDGLPEFFWSQNAPLSPAQSGEQNPDDQKVVNLEKRMNPIGFHVDFVQNQDRQNHLQQDGENHQENATPSPVLLENPQIQLAIKTAEEMLNNGWRLSGDDTRQGKMLGRGSLAKAAGVNDYCARRALDWVRQNRQAN